MKTYKKTILLQRRGRKKDKKTTSVVRYTSLYYIQSVPTEKSPTFVVITSHLLVGSWSGPGPVWSGLGKTEFFVTQIIQVNNLCQVNGEAVLVVVATLCTSCVK